MTLSATERRARPPIDYAVISQALIAGAREMGVKLIRSAYSTILREARDGSAGLIDRDGNTVAQAELIPMQLGPIGETLRACLRAPSRRDAEGRRLPTSTTTRSRAASTCTTSSSSRRSSSSGAGRGLRRLGGASSRPRRRRAGPQHPMPPTSTRKGCASRPRATISSTTGTAARSSGCVTANVRVPDLTIGDFNAQFAANAIGASG